MAKRAGLLVRAWKLFCYSLGSLVALVAALQLWFFGHIAYWNFAHPSTTAFMTAAGAPIAPASPQPFTPSTLCVHGTSVVETLKEGTLSARGGDETVSAPLP